MLSKIVESLPNYSQRVWLWLNKILVSLIIIRTCQEYSFSLPNLFQTSCLENLCYFSLISPPSLSLSPHREITIWKLQKFATAAMAMTIKSRSPDSGFIQPTKNSSAFTSVEKLRKDPSALNSSNKSISTNTIHGTFLVS